MLQKYTKVYKKLLKATKSYKMLQNVTNKKAVNPVRLTAFILFYFLALLFSLCHSDSPNLSTM
jgi:hypothetical protein